MSEILDLIKNLSKDDIIFAINLIDDKGIASGEQSSYYDVLYEGKKYPPKLIISEAIKKINRFYWRTNKF